MTSYESVYQVFRDKVDAYDLLNLTDLEEADVLQGYLKSAIVRFGRACPEVLNYNHDDKTFNINLTDEQIDILSEIMVEYWVKTKLYNSENLRNNLSTKDYSFYSPANLLLQLRELHKDATKNARSLINTYSILNSEYESLRKR